MIITNPHLCTHMEVWQPKYSAQYKDYDEPVALLHKQKVDYATPTIIIEFTRAKHLEGQRFAIRKDFAQRHPLSDNGKAPMYCVPMSHLSSWFSDKEDILKTVKEIGF